MSVNYLIRTQFQAPVALTSGFHANPVVCNNLTYSSKSVIAPKKARTQSTCLVGRRGGGGGGEGEGEGGRERERGGRGEGKGEGREG